MNATAAAALLALAAGPASAHDYPIEPVAVVLRPGKTPGGVCAGPLVYLYPFFPEISGADGSSKLPPFEVPAPGAEHWEAPCTAGAFTFRSIPDGSYVAGMPGPAADRRALVADATVVDGQAIAVELKPQTPAH